MELSDVKEMVRIGWLTLAAVPDPDRRFLGWKNGWALEVVRDVREAYGYAAARVRRFSPSTSDVTRLEEVMGWMAWLRRNEGELAMRRIMTWAYGVPIWRLGQREFRSERTIQRRIDRSIAAIINEFQLCQDPEFRTQFITVIDEPPERTPRSFGEKAIAGDESSAEGGKVYIGGDGYYFRGRRYDPEGRLGKALAKGKRRKQG